MPASQVTAEAAVPQYQLKGFYSCLCQGGGPRISWRRSTCRRTGNPLTGKRFPSGLCPQLLSPDALSLQGKHLRIPEHLEIEDVLKDIRDADRKEGWSINFHSRHLFHLQRKVHAEFPLLLINLRMLQNCFM